jgi:beta-phosphoglucomutase
MAVASSSRNANQMTKAIPFNAGQSLLDAFSVNVCGRDFPEGAQLGILSARRGGVAD